MHGLEISSEVPLPDAREDGSDGPADVVFRFGAGRAVPADAPPGRVLAQLPRSDGEGAFFTLVANGGGECTFRCHGVCDVVISRDLTTATFFMDPSADEGLASVLASGLVISTILILRGHLVLHASAVEVEGAAVAVTGRAGMGKSTVSTLLCKAGARLVSDDVLRIDLGGDRVECRLGAGETRLRPAAGVLVTPKDRARSTADGRLAVALPRATSDHLPLRCIVVPVPDRAADEVDVEHPSQADALMLLSAFPRIVGWNDPRTRGEQFALTGELVARIPIVIARLPWGPPFRESLGRELLAALPR
jgi:hypothetical protein